MEIFFKKYLWILLLLVIGLAAALFAAGATRLLASAVLVPEPVPLVVEKAPEVKLVREGRGSAILARNLFDSSANAAPVEEALVEEEEQPDASELLGQDIELGDNIPISDLQVTVTGTIVSSIPSQSSAAIFSAGATKLYQESDTIRDDAEIVAIRRENVFILRNSRIERLPLLDEDKRKAGGGRPAPGVSSAPPAALGGVAGPAVASAAAAGGKDPMAAVREGIKKTGPEEYEIDRGMLEEQLQDLSKLSSQARIIPHYKDGKSDGFKLVGIRPGSIYSHIGIRSGDVLKRVNGESLDNPSKALALYEKLRSTSNVTVDVERRGSNVTMTYNIK